MIDCEYLLLITGYRSGTISIFDNTFFTICEMIRSG